MSMSSLELIVRCDGPLYGCYCWDLNFCDSWLIIKVHCYMAFAVLHGKIRSSIDEQLNNLYVGLQSLFDNASAIIVSFLHVITVFVQQNLYLIFAIVGEHKSCVPIDILLE